MAVRRAIDGRAIGWMILVCAIWGLQQTALKAASVEMAPVLQVATRSGVAALPILWLIAARRELSFLQPVFWLPGVAVGALYALEFLLVGEGLRYTDASRMAIFLYTAPIFTALALHCWRPEERLDRAQWAGMLLSFAGIALCFAGSSPGRSGSGEQWLGDLMGIGAGLAWAATTLAIRFSRLDTAPATVTTFYQLLGAFVLLLAAALLRGETQVHPSTTLLVSLTFQILFVAILSFLVWFALLQAYRGPELGLLSFLTPVFGIAFGAWLLGERVSPGFLSGSALVLVGIICVKRPPASAVTRQR